MINTCEHLLSVFVCVCMRMLCMHLCVCACVSVSQPYLLGVNKLSVCE